MKFDVLRAAVMKIAVFEDVTLIMDSVISSETSINVYQTTECCIQSQ